jgi:hypothetical protein
VLELTHDKMPFRWHNHSESHAHVLATASEISDLFTLGRDDYCGFVSFEITKRDGNAFSDTDASEELAIHYLRLDYRDGDMDDFEYDSQLMHPREFLDFYGDVEEVEVEFTLKVTAEGGATQTKDVTLIIKICGCEDIDSHYYWDDF